MSICTEWMKEINNLGDGISSGDTFEVVHKFGTRLTAKQYIIIDIQSQESGLIESSQIIDITSAVTTEYIGDNSECALGYFLYDNRLNIKNFKYGNLTFSQNITKEFVREERLKEQIENVVCYAEAGDTILMETTGSSVTEFLILKFLKKGKKTCYYSGYTLANLKQKCTTLHVEDNIRNLIVSLVEVEGKEFVKNITLVKSHSEELL